MVISDGLLGTIVIGLWEWSLCFHLCIFMQILRINSPKCLIKKLMRSIEVGIFLLDKKTCIIYDGKHICWRNSLMRIKNVMWLCLNKSSKNGGDRDAPVSSEGPILFCFCASLGNVLRDIPFFFFFLHKLNRNIASGDQRFVIGNIGLQKCSSIRLRTLVLSPVNLLSQPL